MTDLDPEDCVETLLIPVMPGALCGRKDLMNVAISFSCIGFMISLFSSSVTCFSGKSRKSLRFFSFGIFLYIALHRNYVFLLPLVADWLLGSWDHLWSIFQRRTSVGG